MKEIKKKNAARLIGSVATWRARIKMADKTEAGFAAEVGISKSVLSGYLNGRNKPTIDKFELIENRLRNLGV